MSGVPPIALPTPLHPPPAPARRSLRSRSPSVPVLLLAVRRRRPFPFRPLDSPRGADPNFEFRQETDRARRPRAAVAFASCPRNAEEGCAVRAVPRRAFVSLFCVSLLKRGRRGRCRRTSTAGTRSATYRPGRARSVAGSSSSSSTQLKSPSRSPSDFSIRGYKTSSKNRSRNQIEVEKVF